LDVGLDLTALLTAGTRALVVLAAILDGTRGRPVLRIQPQLSRRQGRQEQTAGIMRVVMRKQEVLKLQ